MSTVTIHRPRSASAAPIDRTASIQVVRVPQALVVALTAVAVLFVATVLLLAVPRGSADPGTDGSGHSGHPSAPVRLPNPRPAGW